ncbi:MAG TPA: trehalase family glycosidase [Candidatus Saccharimonadales bacterium]|nr:trehalase family glycosidase [Candidatus Saccharimonadales bacterium]
MSVTPDEISERAIEVLKKNDRGLYTIPAEALYPHQWLWDSCFIAIGQRHYDVERAKMEILSLLRGQWSNGMLPHTVFSKGRRFSAEHNAWRSWISPYAPDDVVTSGITQPPLLAEAVVRIGEKLHLPERRSWYRQVFPALLAYHEWLYRERDPHEEGMTLQIHPWETGLDNTPPWMNELHEHLLPWWVRILQKTRLEIVAGWFRRDTQVVPAEQRFSNVDAMALFDAQRRLRRKEYNIDRILSHSLFAIEDLAFNSIFVRANEHLLSIAKTLRADLPEPLVKRVKLSREVFDELWDPYTETYYPRDFVTHKLIKEPSIAALLPLYAGCISQERAALLVKSLENEHIFGPPHPVPSVPLNSPWFKSTCYWQGPTWLNINWLIVDGLRRYGYKDHAEALIESSVELVRDGNFNEYFNPLSGEPLGSPNFSWTAAVILDWLKTNQ